MTSRIKNISAMLLIAVVAVAFTACGTSPKQYLADALGHTFHNKYSKSYITEGNITEDEAQQIYDENMKNACLGLFESVGVASDEVTEATKTDATNFFKEIFNTVSFKVESVKSDGAGGYDATVSFVPVDFWSTMPTEKLTELVTVTQSKLDELTEAGTLTQEISDEIIATYAQDFINVFIDNIENTTLLPSETTTIKLVVIDNILSVAEGEISRFETLLVK